VHWCRCFHHKLDTCDWPGLVAERASPAALQTVERAEQDLLREVGLLRLPFELPLGVVYLERALGNLGQKTPT
jgi:hypothetical protein